MAWAATPTVGPHRPRATHPPALARSRYRETWLLFLLLSGGGLQLKTHPAQHTKPGEQLPKALMWDKQATKNRKHR